MSSKVMLPAVSLTNKMTSKKYSYKIQYNIRRKRQNRYH